MILRMLAASAAAVMVLAPVAGSAQDAEAAAQSTPAAAPQPMIVAQPVGVPANSNMLTLPANTPITVRMNEELSTQRHREGHTFYATTVTDVVRDGYVVIPAGSRAVGRITWLTRKGAFGKSGKMDVSIDAIELGGTRVPTIGTFRQEGEGNTVATVGAVVVAGVFGAFVTGRSGVIPAGRELEITTRDNFTVALGGAAPSAAAVAVPVVTPVVTPVVQPAG